MNLFSSKNRASIIEELNSTSFDLLIIGGGITGAGIALDASVRGLKVALIDKQDFAGGTSSKSTKLIHGGLRYLKQLEFKLVSEVGKEREIVHRNAPHLTKPEPMLLPIVKNGSLGKLSARFGMLIYEWLAGVKKEEWHKVLTVEQTIKYEPLLNKENLLGGILFYEYRTDDARLTIEVLKEASSKGAIALNYAKVISFVYEIDIITGVIVEDVFTGKEFVINAKQVVNATGPWVDEIDDLDKNKNAHKLQITKGIHLVVDHKKLPVTQSVYFDTFDKRMIFIIPREGKTYIGTTDTFYQDNINCPGITNDDRDYILKCVNDFFPDISIQIKDLESGWAGLRPLINKPGKGPSEISRKDEVFIYPSGLLTISGGKLTGYRKMAQRITDIVSNRMQDKYGKLVMQCSTNTLVISGGHIDRNTSFKQFIAKNVNEGIELKLTRVEIELLANRYGSNIGKIFLIIKELDRTEKHSIPLILRAQIVYCIENEMCSNPSDFFIRRTGALYFDIELVNKWKNEVLIYMQAILLWDENLAKKHEIGLENSLSEIKLLKL